jgi:hypothetical protein
MLYCTNRSGNVILFKQEAEMLYCTVQTTAAEMLYCTNRKRKCYTVLTGAEMLYCTNRKRKCYTVQTGAEMLYCTNRSRNVILYKQEAEMLYCTNRKNAYAFPRTHRVNIQTYISICVKITLSRYSIFVFNFIYFSSLCHPARRVSFNFCQQIYI